jgi:hypothetical protein
MAAFVSYSHQDRSFVDKLAAHLVKNRARVWVDRWELNVGDSLITKVQGAIQAADALLVVLSRASVASEWCQKELSAGLVRELEEKRVVVLPILLEDCDIPLFLRDKLYADFRTDFDRGFHSTLNALAAVTSDTLGRVDGPEYHTDWAVDWGEPDGQVEVKWTFVNHSEALPYCAITEVTFRGNAAATHRYKQFDSEGLGWLSRLIMLEGLYEALKGKELHLMLLEDNFPKTRRIELADKNRRDLTIIVTARRLGTDTGKDLLLDWGQHLEMVRAESLRRKGRFTEDEVAALVRLGVRPP